jgi:hypothetical protein
MNQRVWSRVVGLVVRTHTKNVSRLPNRMLLLEADFEILFEFQFMPFSVKVYVSHAPDPHQVAGAFAPQ